MVDVVPVLDEILDTTGLTSATWTDAAWTGYVERLGRAGVIALGFGIGLTHAAVPINGVRRPDRTRGRASPRAQPLKPCPMRRAGRSRRR
jgi:hypothetical protein